MQPHEYIQDMIAEALAADEWLRERRVSVIRQNGVELAEAIRKATAETAGVALVISYDKERVVATKPRTVEVEFSLLASEWVALNRRGRFATAMDAAARARDVLSADRALIPEDTVHSSPAPGQLVAVQRWRTRVAVADPE